MQSYALNIEEFLTAILLPIILKTNNKINFTNDVENINVDYEINLLDGETIFASQSKICRTCLSNNIETTSDLIVLLEKSYTVEYEHAIYANESERNGFRSSDFYS